MRDNLYGNPKRHGVYNIRRKMSIEKMNYIEHEERMKGKEKGYTKGPRQIFLDKYKVTGDMEEAKKELEENGFKSSIYNDEIYQNWIDEDR